MKELANFFHKSYLRLVLARTPYAFRLTETVGTSLVYSQWFRYLVDKDFRTVIEVGPGTFSVPALAIKASGLSRKFSFVAIDKNEEHADQLRLFLKQIGLKGDVLTKSFEKSVTSASTPKSVVVFDHSLDDLIIDHLLAKRGIEYRTWEEALCFIESDECCLSHPEIADYVAWLLQFLQEYCEERRSCFLLHHFKRPHAEQRSHLIDLDQVIVDVLRRQLNRSAAILRDLIVFQNYQDEILMLGGHTWR